MGDGSHFDVLPSWRLVLEGSHLVLGEGSDYPFVRILSINPLGCYSREAQTGNCIQILMLAMMRIPLHRRIARQAFTILKDRVPLDYDL